MYPITCAGGYSIPVKAGQFDIIGIRATVSNTAAASQIILYDDGYSGEDWGRILPGTFDPGSSEQVKVVLISNIKGIANVDANLEVLFPEPVRIRHGTSVSKTTNLVPGSIQVYCR